MDVSLVALAAIAVLALVLVVAVESGVRHSDRFEKLP